MSIITNGLPSFEKQIQFGRRITFYRLFYGLPFLIFVTKKYFTEPEGTKKKPGGGFFFRLRFCFYSSIIAIHTPASKSGARTAQLVHFVKLLWSTKKLYPHHHDGGGKEST